MRESSKIVEEMNSLGTSSKDNAKYDALKLEREKLYKECVPIPILKNAVNLNILTLGKMRMPKKL